MSGLTPEQLRQLRLDLASKPAPATGEHLTTDEMLDYAFERCAPEDVDRIERHLDGCDVCAEDMDCVCGVTGPLVGPYPSSAGERERYGVIVGRATAEQLQGLAMHVGSGEDLERLAALEIVSALGAVAATPEFLSTLAAHLGAEDGEVRVAAAGAVARLGAAAATPEILAALGRCLRDEIEEVQEAAAYAFGDLGTAAAVADIEKRLITLTKSLDPTVRTAAAWALRRLGPAITEPAVIDGMLKRLGDPAAAVRAEVKRFIETVPAAARRFRATARDSWKRSEAKIIRVPALEGGFGAPQGEARQDYSRVPAGWTDSGTLANGLIEYEIDQDPESGDVEVRFGSRMLKPEDVVLALDAIAAPGDRTTIRPEDESFLWLVVLEQWGSDQVGGYIRIPHADLPRATPYGVELRVRVLKVG